MRWCWLRCLSLMVLVMRVHDDGDGDCSECCQWFGSQLNVAKPPFSMRVEQLDLLLGPPAYSRPNESGNVASNWRLATIPGSCGCSPWPVGALMYHWPGPTRASLQAAWLRGPPRESGAFGTSGNLLSGSRPGGSTFA